MQENNKKVLCDIDGREILVGDVVQLVRCCSKHPNIDGASFTVYEYGRLIFPFDDMMNGDAYHNSTNYRIVSR